MEGEAQCPPEAEEAEAAGITASLLPTGGDDGDTFGRADAGAGTGGTGEGGGYVPYMSAAKRARMEREAALMEASGLDPSEAGFEDGPSSNSTSDRVREAKARKALASLGSGGAKKSDDTDEDEKESADTAAAERDGDTDGEDQEDDANDEEAVTTLLEQAAALKQKREALSESERAALARKEEEERILREASQVQTNALQAASELAKGVSYRESLPTSWRCPRKILAEGRRAGRRSGTSGTYWSRATMFLLPSVRLPI